MARRWSSLTHSHHTFRGIAASTVRRTTLRLWAISAHLGISDESEEKISAHMARHGFRMEEERLDHAATPALAAYKGRMLTYRRE